MHSNLWMFCSFTISFDEKCFDDDEINRHTAVKHSAQCTITVYEFKKV